MNDSAPRPSLLRPASDPPASPRQLRYLQAVAREAEIDAASLDEWVMQEFGVRVDELTLRQASALVDVMQSGQYALRNL